jgi:uncharacterized protein (DUF2249 family)
VVASRPVAQPSRPASSTPAQPNSARGLDSRARLSDEHAVLLWQICAYVDELVEAARSGRGLIAAFDTLLKFLRYRLLPYLTAEERQLAAAELPPAHRAQQLIDHDEIRESVESIETAQTEALTLLATAALVSRIDEHVRAEQTWLPGHRHSAPDNTGTDRIAGWVLPLLLTNDIDLDTLPAGSADALVLTRLLRMRCGDAVRLRARHDLHPLWRQLRARNHGDHAWVYEAPGPENWVARITRREIDYS